MILYGDEKVTASGSPYRIKNLVRVSGPLPSLESYGYKGEMIYTDPKLSQAGHVLFFMERLKPKTIIPKS